MSVQNSDPVLAEQPDQTYGIYIHVPFCVRKCSYCSFYSVASGAKWFDRYVDAVCREIARESERGWSRGRKVESIFFGGGTPTVLRPEQLVLLLRECESRFDFQADAVETSLEVNPATIEYEGLICLRQGGFNRISIGVQSFDDSELERIGRVHTAVDAVATVAQARKAGFSNLSLDLMYGLPGQRIGGWQETLQQALVLQPDHLSMYELTIEAETPFSVLAEQGELDLPHEDEVLAMLDYTGQSVEQAGLQRYEISNYTRPGYECRHNVNYWHNGSYLGFGPGAVSCRSGRRSAMLTDVEQFCRRVQAGESVVVDEEELTVEERFRETVIMGLRMLAGVPLAGLEARFGINAVSYYGETLARLQQQGLVEIEQGRLRLSGQGLLLANSVMAELV